MDTMIRGICIIVILMTGCLHFSSAGNETVIDRVREECADRGGTWTTVGCVYAILGTEA